MSISKYFLVWIPFGNVYLLDLTKEGIQVAKKPIGNGKKIVVDNFEIAASARVKKMGRVQNFYLL